MELKVVSMKVLSVFEVNLYEDTKIPIKCNKKILIY